MSSLDSRNNSAYAKRAEQLKRWEESDTNREPITPKNINPKIKFSSGCIFLAACVAGDKDEVKQLLDAGADIDTTNIDGLTALHQACIDDNLDMVEFLISQGADVNRKDNEGWTPLHVTASCDLLSIAQYLIENGADLAAINSDGDLPVDLVQSAEMRDLIQKYIHEQGIDCDEAKQIEEKIMLEDAKRWLRSDASEADRPHPKTGATALHVAAAKGYTKVLSLLLAGRADVDKQDADGWTPLHAASHWGQKEAVQMLVASLADMDILNYAGQSAIDVAEDDIVPLLEELRKNNKRTKRRPASQIRISEGNNMDNNVETPSKVIRVEVKSEDKLGNKLGHISESDSESNSSSECLETDSQSSSDTSTSLSDRQIKRLEEKSKQPQLETVTIRTTPQPVTIDKPFSKDKELIQQEEEQQSWRRPNAIRIRDNRQESPPKTHTINSNLDKQQKVPDDKENTTPQQNTQNTTPTDSEVILRRTHSFESDAAFYTRLQELRARIKANSCSNLPVPQQIQGNGAGNNQTNQLNNFIVQRSASLKDHKQIQLRKPPASPPSSPVSTPGSATTGVRSPPSTAAELLARRLSSPEVSGTSTQPPCPPFSKLKMNNAINNNGREEETTDQNSSSNSIDKGQGGTPTSPFSKFKNFFKSFVPPTRDEESETQRKAHAKRVRETRRSTQGVTLEEIKSAEQLVKKKNSTNSENETTNVTATISIANDRVPAVPSVDELLNDKREALRSKLSSQRESPPVEQVSASYTIVAPSYLRNRTISNDETEKTRVSASYTIPVTNVELSKDYNSGKHTVSNNGNHSKSTSTSITSTINTTATATTAPSVTATFNVPLNSIGGSNNNNNTNNNNNSSTLKKTDSVESMTEKPKSSPTVKSRFKWNEEEKTLEPSQPENIDSKPVPASRFNPDYPVHRYVRDKRSIFDTDAMINNSNLTLAEKLRIEASKYADTSRSNNDLPFVRSDSAESDTSSTASIKKYDSVPSSPAHHTTERRPSWRLRPDLGSKFKLEDQTSNRAQPAVNQAAFQPTSNAILDASKMPVIPVAATRRALPTTNSIAAPTTTASSTITQSNVVISNNRPLVHTTVQIGPSAGEQGSEQAKQTAPQPVTEATLPIARQRNKPNAGVEDNKDNDKENDSRSAQNTQALIQRRRRPKRRSTGVVHLDADETDPDKQDENEKESGGEQSRDAASANKDEESLENGEFIDYKALYEAAKAENDQLKQQLRKKDEELTTTKAALERFTNATTKNTLSEIEKRERRAMERKISEMEEELKQMDTLKADNQRLKDENGALIRVISKLSK